MKKNTYNKIIKCLREVVALEFIINYLIEYLNCDLKKRYRLLVPIFNKNKSLISINDLNDELFFFKLGELLVILYLFNIKKIEHIKIGVINNNPVFISNYKIEQNIIHTSSCKASNIAWEVLNKSTYKFKFLIFDKENNFILLKNLPFIKNGFKFMYLIIINKKSSIEALLKEKYDEFRCYPIIQNLIFFTEVDLNRQLYFIDVLLNEYKFSTISESNSP